MAARTPGRFRTRVITEGVIPSLHVDYKRPKIKQYHKEGRALRTETTINNTRDFGIGKRLKNLPALREVGFPANRRLLDVQRSATTRASAKTRSAAVARPDRWSTASAPPRCASATSRPGPALGPGRRSVSCPTGSPTATCASTSRHCSGVAPALTPGRMTYDLRRLRLHGLIERIPGTHRYRLTDHGSRAPSSSPAPTPGSSAPASLNSLDPADSSSLHRELDRLATRSDPPIR